MKAKYWLIGGISSIAFGFFLNVSYQSFLSKNFPTDLLIPQQHKPIIFGYSLYC